MEEETLNMDMVYEVMDCYKNALVLTREVEVDVDPNIDKFFRMYVFSQMPHVA